MEKDSEIGARGSNRPSRHVLPINQGEAWGREGDTGDDQATPGQARPELGNGASSGLLGFGSSIDGVTSQSSGQGHGFSLNAPGGSYAFFVGRSGGSAFASVGTGLGGGGAGSAGSGGGSSTGSDAAEEGSDAGGGVGAGIGSGTDGGASTGSDGASDSVETALVSDSGANDPGDQTNGGTDEGGEGNAADDPANDSDPQEGADPDTGSDPSPDFGITLPTLPPVPTYPSDPGDEDATAPVNDVTSPEQRADIVQISEPEVLPLMSVGLGLLAVAAFAGRRRYG